MIHDAVRRIGAWCPAPLPAHQTALKREQLNDTPGHPPSRDDPPVKSDARAVPRWATDAASAVPLVTALVVGSTYGFGSVIALGRLHDAGLPTSDTFPLIPLQSVVASGIKNAIGLVLVLPLILVFAYGEHRRIEAAKRVVRPRIVRYTLAVGVPFVATSFFLAWDVAVPAIAITAAALFLVEEKQLSLGRLAMVTYALLVLWGMIDSYIYPRPLPRAELVVDGRPRPVEGELIVVSDGTYVVHMKGRAYQRVRVDNVREATFNTRKLPTARPLFDVLF